MNPIISIVMPVYNVAPYLRECLDSVRAQTFADWECICVDDGSTDDSPAILAEYAEKDKRLRVIRREHSNAGACRNAGMDMAQGAFLSFLDSDDIFAPKMLEILAETVERHHADVVTCEMLRFRDGDVVPRLARRIYKTCIREYLKPCSSVDIYSLWSGRAWDKLFRRSFVLRERLRFQEIRSTNDARFVYSALSLSEKVVVVHSPLIAYRVSAGSLERTHHLSPSCVGQALESYAGEMMRRGVFRDNPSLEWYFKKWAVYVLFWNMDIINTSEGYKEAHALFSRFCGTFGFRKLLESDELDGRVDSERLRLICDGGSAFDSLLLHKFKLLREVENLRPLRGIDRTYAYRIGRIVMWLPKRIKLLFHFPR